MINLSLFLIASFLIVENTIAGVSGYSGNYSEKPVYEEGQSSESAKHSKSSNLIFAGAGIGVTNGYSEKPVYEEGQTNRSNKSLVYLTSVFGDGVSFKSATLTNQNSWKVQEQYLSLQDLEAKPRLKKALIESSQNQDWNAL